MAPSVPLDLLLEAFANKVSEKCFVLEVSAGLLENTELGGLIQLLLH